MMSYNRWHWGGCSSLWVLCDSLISPRRAECGCWQAFNLSPKLAPLLLWGRADLGPQPSAGHRVQLEFHPTVLWAMFLTLLSIGRNEHLFFLSNSNTNFLLKIILLTYATTKMNLQNMMLSERIQAQKGTYCMISFLWNIQNKKVEKTYRNRKQIGGCQGQRKEGWRGLGNRKQLLTGGASLGVVKMFSS